MVQWNLFIPEKTDRAVRDFLERDRGGQVDISAFVDEAVRREILRRTVNAIQEQNTDLNEQEAGELAEEAVAWARMNHS
jgi:hypothetical protein